MQVSTQDNVRDAVSCRNLQKICVNPHKSGYICIIRLHERGPAV